MNSSDQNGHTGPRLGAPEKPEGHERRVKRLFFAVLVFLRGLFFGLLELWGLSGLIFGRFGVPLWMFFFWASGALGPFGVYFWLFWCSFVVFLWFLAFGAFCQGVWD